MPSFVCASCEKAVTKPKIKNHLLSCRGATFTCIDCTKHFQDDSVHQHTSCVTEVDKYHGKFAKKNQPNTPQSKKTTPAKSENSEKSEKSPKSKETPPKPEKSPKSKKTPSKPEESTNTKKTPSKPEESINTKKTPSKPEESTNTTEAPSKSEESKKRKKSKGTPSKPEESPSSTEVPLKSEGTPDLKVAAPKARKEKTNGGRKRKHSGEGEQTKPKRQKSAPEGITVLRAEGSIALTINLKNKTWKKSITRYLRKSQPMEIEVLKEEVVCQLMRQISSDLKKKLEFECPRMIEGMDLVVSGGSVSLKNKV